LEPAEENCRIRIRIRKSVVPGGGIIFSQNIKYEAFSCVDNCMLSFSKRYGYRTKWSTSVADPGCLSRIRIFLSRIQGQKDSIRGFTSKNFSLSIFNPKNCFESLGNMIRDDHPGSGSRIRILIFFTHPGSRVPGFKKGTGSRIRNTVENIR
jgi:hypothetical protein